MFSLHPREETNPLSFLQGQSIGGYEIQLYLKALQYRGGWTHFSLSLKDRKGRLSSQRRNAGGWAPMPVLEGIHSPGGRGIKGWIEIGDYYPTVHFRERGFPPSAVHLSRGKLDVRIFQLLSDCVPPGGHLMFAYEVSFESPYHRETQESLTKGFPPVSTAQGELLFRAGFRLVKDWYLSEGGHEGPRKLWGEKPLNKAELRGFDSRTFLQLLSLLAHKPNPSSAERERLARSRALGIMEDLELDLDLSTLRRGIIDNRPKGNGVKAWKEKAHHTCRHIGAVLKTAPLDDHVKEQLSQISNDCVEDFNKNEKERFTSG
jgi:hypothetical protein